MRDKIRKLQVIGLREAVKTVFGNFLRRLLFGKVFTFFEKFGVHVLPVHYYSPVPDTRDLRRKLDQWYREWSFTGVNFNLEGQKNLLYELSALKGECDNLPSYKEVAAQGFGEGYGETESHILHAMIRHFKPRNVIEVGSGVSTVFSVNALSINKKQYGADSKMMCIEPYPTMVLKKMKGDSEIQIEPKFVQDVSIDFFKKLGKEDILFIDSSHIVKINSDVNYLFLEVLPELNEGVIIHIHDISFPYPTPDPEQWIFREHQFWSEAALVQAFLCYNSAFKILLCSSYLHYKAPEALGQVFSIYDPIKHFPASLWLQKIQ